MNNEPCDDKYVICNPGHGFWGWASKIPSGDPIWHPLQYATIFYAKQFAEEAVQREIWRYLQHQLQIMTVSEALALEVMES